MPKQTFGKLNIDSKDSIRLKKKNEINEILRNAPEFLERENYQSLRKLVNFTKNIQKRK